MLAISTYVFPLVATPLLGWAWWRIAGGNWRLVALVMIVPIAFGYLVAWLATSLVKRWRMTGGWRIGGAYVHHGFIYGSKMAFVLLLATRDPMGIRSWVDLISVALLVGAATAFGGWLHDLHAIRQGRIVFTGLDKREAEEALASLAPLSYFTVGATYAVVSIAGWQVVAAQPELFWLILVIALVALCVVPSLVFFAMDANARQALRRNAGF
jgi:hypothetical protein